MEKSFFYAVPWQEAKHYAEALQAIGVSYQIESPLDFPLIAEGHLAFVFPSLPIRLYAKVRVLFGQDGRRYP